MSLIKTLPFSIIVLFATQLLALSSEGYLGSNDLKGLKREYQLMKEAVNNPDLIWLPFYTPDGRPMIMTLSETKEWVRKNILKEWNGNLREYNEQYIAVLFKTVESSKATKQKIKREILPTIAFRIKELEAEQSTYSSQERGTDEERLDSVMESLTDPGSLELLGSVWESGQDDTENNGTSHFVSGAQTSSFDSVEDAYYHECPKINPDPSSGAIKRFYQPGNKKNYRDCYYYRTSHPRANSLFCETPYINKQKDGVQLEYRYNQKFNLYYLFKRASYSKGKFDGIVDSYSVTKTGAVYHREQCSYVDGKMHGDQIIRWPNGKTKEERQKFMNKSLKTRYYNKEGKLIQCYKYDSFGNTTNCMPKK